MIPIRAEGSFYRTSIIPNYFLFTKLITVKIILVRAYDVFLRETKTIVLFFIDLVRDSPQTRVGFLCFFIISQDS